MVNYEEIIADMEQTLKRKAKARGFEITDNDICDEINDAIEAVNLRRQFEATSQKPFEEKYKSLIVNLALSSVAKYGAEGETSHSENGIGRSYDSAGNYPEALLNQIVPLGHSRGSLKL